jgi:choline dehydrogenase
MYDNKAANWCYFSEPNATHGNRPLYVPRGKILGGTSAINGMIANRGQPADYDNWASDGCTGWSYRDVLPYFKKLESTSIGDDEYRGRSGPIRITSAQKDSRFYDLFMLAANRLGIPNNADYCGPDQEGVSMAQHSIYSGWRESTATRYLLPAKRRRNLSVLRDAEVSSLVLEGKRCVGVRVSINGTERVLLARREVIVSCGTVNSPKLLELSGIGNPEILKAHGITPIHSLPGVGENLRDHYTAPMKWRFNKPKLSLHRKGHGMRLFGEILKFGLFRKGFIAQAFSSLYVFAKSDQSQPRPDIMMVLIPFIVDVVPGKGRRVAPIDGFAVLPHPQRTESTGSIHIRSSDPKEYPRIDYNILDSEVDKAVAIAAFRKARAIVGSAPLSEHIAEELEPGSAVQSDEEILNFLRTSGRTTNHMVGTCRMGVDELAVVDHRLKVRGIEGLRIADGSVMPTMPSGNTNIPCMMIGEKCADMIIAEQG